jgi:hypothetical protein
VESLEIVNTLEPFFTLASSPSPKFLCNETKDKESANVKDEKFLSQCKKVLGLEHLSVQELWNFLVHALVPKHLYASHTHGLFQQQSLRGNIFSQMTW